MGQAARAVRPRGGRGHDDQCGNGRFETVTSCLNGSNFAATALRFFGGGRFAGTVRRGALWKGTLTPDWDNDTPDFEVKGTSGSPYYEMTGLTWDGTTPPTAGTI